ncbi:hypothetical protein [Leptospira borgpetersenii]|uniref:hypothetical protein n=1 Tax=Leptospira borgpetersenii TaxID=174 RepID=UPI000AFF22DE|nr:hypothetical protein [Leptospira borgpetersenii]MBE8364794.1 hypothetical protein [Leptospira borgpetersenii serovar Balcanica]MBE8366695.1 hypothetical protein [Leptospira borgpetersenii serovar Balcanica]MBE8411437.1 hypothetical protein [Leptospira borgpetersenii serovar Tarassovi]MBE8423077.1 hypothetical protein [Leptospira borgpetersenii serovar Balcanica]MBE8434829.1 hypothetical protein [Leptospira borgpetersenii serovar Tarassovi]
MQALIAKQENQQKELKTCPKTVFCGSGIYRDAVMSPLNVGTLTFYYELTE